MDAFSEMLACATPRLRKKKKNIATTGGPDCKKSSQARAVACIGIRPAQFATAVAAAAAAAWN